MRAELKKNKDKKFHIFYGYLKARIVNDRQLITNIYIVDEDRKKVSKQIDHCLVAAKPFKNIDPNKPVRFTGKVTSYMRSNGSYDYSIIVNKAREASKEELKCYISHANV